LKLCKLRAKNGATTLSAKTFNIMPLSLTTYLILASVSVVMLNAVAPMYNQIRRGKLPEASLLKLYDGLRHEQSVTKQALKHFRHALL
jgi:hypothetical protein